MSTGRERFSKIVSKNAVLLEEKTSLVDVILQKASKLQNGISSQKQRIWERLPFWKMKKHS